MQSLMCRSSLVHAPDMTKESMSSLAYVVVDVAVLRTWSILHLSQICTNKCRVAAFRLSYEKPGVLQHQLSTVGRQLMRPGQFF